MGRAPKEAECAEGGIEECATYVEAKNSSSSSSGRQLPGQRVAWSSSERRVIAAMEDYLESCADMRVDVEALERLMEPEEAEVCLRYILKYSTRRGSNIFQFFDTEEKKDHFVASRRRWLEHQGERVALQESWQHEWQDIEYQGIMAKAPRCPERTLKTPMPQQSSPSSRDEEGQWISGEDRRRRRVLFEETAREC